jgi:glycosyltransferase involved in cell wall biosynthesis
MISNEIVRGIIVSLVIPVRNEEKYIENCIQSILRQDFLRNSLEVIFVDGMSEDKTKEIIFRYIQKYPEFIKLIENPYKTVPYAMNLGIEKSKGKYIVRLDAHSDYTDDYISKCVSTILTVNADNVGGLAITKGHGAIGGAFAKVLSSKFGVGNSGFRTNAKSGFVDTVPFGTFRRETFEQYGFYDERLTRNQDYELNHRIRKNGGTVYLNSDIVLTYYCRDTLSGIVNQSYENGKWNLITSKLCTGSMSLRHFIPLIFMLSLIILPLLIFLMDIFKWILIGELILYIVLSIFFSLKIASRTKQILLIILLFPIFHVSYGFGSFIGLFQNVSKVSNKSV